MLEKLKQTLIGRKETAPFQVPGQIHDSSRILCRRCRPGDLLFHAPLLSAIRRSWPGASLDFLVPEAFAPVVIPSGLARQVMVYGDKQLGGWKPAHRNLQRTLAGAGYDVSIVVSLEPNSVLEGLGEASGAVMRLGPSHPGAWPAVNLELRTSGEHAYLGDRARQLAPFLGLEGLPHRTAWPLPGDKVRQAAQLVHFNKPRPEEWLVGVDPGADKSGRALSTKNLEFLVSQLKSQATCRILPLSMPGNEDRLAQFEAGLTSPVPPAFKRDTLLETVLLLGQCDLFLAGNTDLFHFAVAQRVPTVGLFGSHVPDHWRPSGSRAAILDVAKGEKVNIATLMETVHAVMAEPSPDGGANGARRGPAGGPLPARAHESPGSPRRRCPGGAAQLARRRGHGHAAAEPARRRAKRRRAASAGGGRSAAAGRRSCG